MYEREGTLFKALSDVNRIRILAMLRGGEQCACRIQDELGICQPTLSYHLGLLCDSGMVNAHREGRWMYYSINREGVRRVKEIIDEPTSPCAAAEE